MAKGDAKQRCSSNVKVVVRCRPTNSQEKEGGFKTVVKVIDDHMLVFDPKTDSEAVRFGRAPPKRRGERNTILDRRAKDLRFAFDRVFNEHATNQELFENTTYSVVDNLLEGYNCSVFAYGATSAGKTHTMLGSPKKPGVIFLTMMELYKKIDERTEEFTCDVSVSYLEIYNETARDLLQPSSKTLAVREDPKQGVCVTGLSLHKPINAEELLSMLESGNLNRTQHPTDANKQSSRSHAVFQVFVRQQPKGSGLSTDVKVAKMSLIDLAGSERATVTTNRGARFREGANINRSLLALGNCINALAENRPIKGKKEIHIPYRDSKLTRLLKDSLGGNCKTIMIAAVSPSSMCYEDTYNTLKYANRAKNIKSNLKSNVISVDFHVSNYAKIVEELKQQVEDLKRKVGRYENGDATPMKQQQLQCTQKDQLKVNNITSVTMVAECFNHFGVQEHKKKDTIETEISEITISHLRIQDELCGVYKDRCLIRKQIIDCEAAEKELKIKLFKRERNLERIQIMLGNADPTIDQSVQKLDRFRSATQSKQSQLNAKVQSLVKQLADNSEKISVVKTFADDWMSSVADESLKGSYKVFHEARVLDVEKISARAQAKHLRRYVMLQEKDSHSTERLFSKLLSLVSKQQLKLKETSNLSLELEQEYTSVMNDLEGSRRITWADESTRESLDVSSILNFSSCTPVRTPARSRCVLLANTSQMAAKGVDIDMDEDYTSITALNSVYNSKITRVVTGLSNEVSANMLCASAGSPMPSVPTHPTPGNQEYAVVSIPSNEAFVTDLETKLHGLQQNMTKSSEMETYHRINHNVDAGQSAIVADNIENNVSPSSLSRRGTRTLDDDFEVRNKMPRFDTKFLSPMPEKEATDPAIDVSQHQGCTPAKLLFSGAGSVEIAGRERRGTMIIQKGPDEVSNLPVIKENENVHKDGKVSTVNQEEAEFSNDKEAVLSQTDNIKAEHCRNDDTKCDQSFGILTVNTTKSAVVHNDLNATFDVLPISQDVLREEAGLAITYTCMQSNEADANLSGIEPIEDSPTRQPLSVVCENNLKGNAVTPKTVSLNQHGLPSMRDGSSMKISKAVTPVVTRNATENTKIEPKDPKTPSSASKTGATKSRYASVAPRLYQENPRYANSASKARSRMDKRRRSNTLSNPIRLRDSRRRSRSSTTATPYNLQAARKNVPSHVAGMRKAIEQMGVLKGPKCARNFNPTSASGVMNSMPSSTL